LYDTHADPQQVHNLASSREHQTVLATMRARQRRWLAETCDVGFLPEAEVWARCAGGAPWELARDERRYPYRRIVEAAALVGRAEAVPQQIRLLADEDAGVRYWAAVGLQAAGRAAAPAEPALRKALADAAPSVRVAAAAALGALGEAAPALPVLTQELQSAQRDVALQAARALQLLGAPARPALPVMKAVLASASRTEAAAPQNLFLQFSLGAAVKRLE
jgi:uncharacterized sulfatase